jgi:hypothetical protein
MKRLSACLPSKRVGDGIYLGCLKYLHMVVRPSKTASTDALTSSDITEVVVKVTCLFGIGLFGSG